MGDDVVIKVVKPGIRETLIRDARLLRGVGAALQLVFSRYQPQRVINEFCDYTLKEVDLRREADNCETFHANFADQPDVIFPKIYREISSQSVLVMEYLEGLRPDSPAAQALPLADREKLVDLGTGSIIQMIYRDGFFHADLHPGNLVVLPGPQVGYIDLGMVGRLDNDLRRTLLYYYYSLVMGDADNAARYLAAVAEPGPGGDPDGFRREVSEIAGRWKRASTYEGFSLAQLTLESVSKGAQFRMYFPVELVLMVKSLITYESVGNMLLPGFDVAEVSRSHVRKVFIAQFSPIRLFQEELRGAPDLVDALIKVPSLVTEGLRVLERATKQRQENPLAGLRGTMLAAASASSRGRSSWRSTAPWPAWASALRAGLPPRVAEVTRMTYHDPDPDHRQEALGALPAGLRARCRGASARPDQRELVPREDLRRGADPGEGADHPRRESQRQRLPVRRDRVRRSALEARRLHAGVQAAHRVREGAELRLVDAPLRHRRFLAARRRRGHALRQLRGPAAPEGARAVFPRGGAGDREGIPPPLPAAALQHELRAASARARRRRCCRST